MALSDDLTKLAARAKEAETRTAAARDEARADLERRLNRHAPRLGRRPRSCGRGPRKASPRSRAGGLTYRSRGTRRSPGSARTSRARRRSTTSTWPRCKPTTRGGYASFAIDLAYTAVVEAEYASLDAVLARKEADQMAKQRERLRGDQVMSEHAARREFGSPETGFGLSEATREGDRLLVALARQRYRLARHLAGDPPVRRRLGHYRRRPCRAHVRLRRHPELRPYLGGRGHALGLGDIRGAVRGLCGDLLRQPRGPFAALADILGFLFLLVGLWWMVRAFLERPLNPLWWLGLIGVSS